MTLDQGRVPGPAAAIAIAGVLGLAGIVARRYSPDPTHPRIASWYAHLDKPSYKPPDPLFGAIWPALQLLHSYGAYRLMTSPRSPERDAALGFWATDIALVTGWAKAFFGERSPLGGAVVSAALVASAAAHIERAARVDTAAAACAVPFALWSIFGGLMTEDIRERNQPG
jgi:tryptophan-rich sensory protein